MIILAPFYKDTDLKFEGHEVNEMSQIFDYKKNLIRMYDTFFKFNTSYNFEITSDQHTRLKNFNVFRSNLDNLNIMESFCVSNLEYVKSKNDKLILCGADHLVNSSVNGLFNSEFDIGIAIVGNPLRVNNTIVLVNNTNKKNVVEFFERRYDCYKRLSENDKLWFGDQLSYQKILEEEQILNFSAKNLPIGTFHLKNLTIKLFQYGSNFVSPIKKQIPEIGVNPIIIDFKGPKRKKRAESIYKEIMK
jgi:hypothetical protein